MKPAAIQKVMGALRHDLLEFQSKTINLQAVLSAVFSGTGAFSTPPDPIHLAKGLATDRRKNEIEKNDFADGVAVFHHDGISV